MVLTVNVTVRDDSAGGHQLLCLWALAWTSHSPEKGTACSPMPFPTGPCAQPLTFPRANFTYVAQLAQVSLDAIRNSKGKELRSSQSGIVAGTNKSVEVAWPDPSLGCVTQAGDLLEHVLPIWSLHLVFLSMATTTHRCGKGWACAGVESGVSVLFPGNEKVHKPGWPWGILLPSSTGCPSDCLGKAGIAALSQVLHMAPPLLEDPEVLLIVLYQGNSTSFNVFSG